jgi:hypothetical protein
MHCVILLQAIALCAMRQTVLLCEVFKTSRGTEKSQIGNRAAAKPLVRQEKPAQYSFGVWISITTPTDCKGVLKPVHICLGDIYRSQASQN